MCGYSRSVTTLFVLFTGATSELQNKKPLRACTNTKKIGKSQGLKLNFSIDIHNNNNQMD